MCQSKADGGQRCVTHTRPHYQALMKAIDSCPTGMFGRAQRDRVRQTFTSGGQNAVNIIADHASTTGYKDIERDIARLQEAHVEPQLLAVMQAQLNVGKARGLASKAAAAQIRKQKTLATARVKGWRQEGSKDIMRRRETIEPGTSCADVVPRISVIWDRTLNVGPDGEPVGPEHVTPGVNDKLFWRCEAQGHVNEARVNTVAPRLRDLGKFPICPQCQPHRARQFAAAQENLTGLVEMLGGDPTAFDALSPALQHDIMRSLGLATGSGVERDLTASIVHGDLTLADAVRAADFSKIENKLRDDLSDDDAALGTVTDIETNSKTAKELGQKAKVSQIMNAAGAMQLAPDSDLAQHVMRENIDALWVEAEKNPAKLDDLLATIDANRGKSPFAAALADRFTAEFDAAMNTPLPEGYATDRSYPDGTVRSIEPTPMQRRFAYLTEQQRRIANWSGTGAGKTTAGALAIQRIDANETLIVCPNGGPMYQWRDEFETGYPGKVDVRLGLPTGDEEPPAPGVNRVWIANYEKFSGDPETLKTRLAGLQNRVDAVVFDEIHKAKITGSEESAAKRRIAMQGFTDAAGRTNPNLVVMGMSATAVVNNLDEAKSELRLIEGPQSKPFATGSTIKNAITAHHRLAERGIRLMPTYPTKLKREEINVDVTDRVANIHARVNTLRRQAAEQGKSSRVNASMMERALLPEKIPAIVDKCKTNQGPTIVYTEYTKGMTKPMHAALSEAGLRVAQYTGDESEATRQDIITRFRRGEYDVLIGSKPISTGVDGLQDVAHNIVVASPTWTAADDDQLVGRLQRRGQQHDVNVSYVVTEAKVGKTRWSWCKDNRLNRIGFKRSLADAAMDGIIPDGVLGSEDSAASKSADALNAMVSEYARSGAASTTNAA